MRRLVLLGLALCAMLALVPPASGGRVKSRVSLNQYTVKVQPAVYQELLSEYDVVSQRNVRGRIRVDLVLSRKQARALRTKGIGVVLKRTKRGKTMRQAAAAQALGGYTVWRDYDGSDGIRAQLYVIARNNPQITKLEVIGHSTQNREILALKLTQGARGIADGARPAVLYSAVQHAREWIAGEVDIRILKGLLVKYRADDKATKDMLKATELWFVVIANPDGYQYTFQSPDTRLWRKTLRDNDGNGIITVGDGVDPNRNYPEHWNYDNEGSSSAMSSETYRGPSEGSEPETQAMTGLLDRIKFKFQVNFHSFGQWLLYPEGWQISTPSGDDPIYFALSGNKDNPAIPGFTPGLSSDVLYVTNGETTDYAHVVDGTLAWTPELSEGCQGCGFVFPDNEALVQAEYLKVLPFSMDVAKSATRVANPVSHLGLATKPFYLKSDDTYKFGLPEANFTFAVSYGDPQPVRVNALRSLGAVTLKYRINGGVVRSGPTSEWNGGEKFGGKTDRYYHVMGGQVTGTNAGDSVEVWFEGGGKTSPSFTYSAAVETSNRVLVVSAEDYTGASPPQAPGPHYLRYYLNALAASGIGADVYDVDASGRKAPTSLGVLGHYDAVIWYTGDDIIPRELGWSGGNASRLAMDEMLHMRSYVNEGGRVLYTGGFAGHGYTPAHGAQLYDPTEANAQCQGAGPTLARCLPLAGVGDGQNDVLQYWFGAYILNDAAGLDEDGNPFDVLGTDDPFNGTGWSFNGPDSGNNQFHNSSFITTSGILPVSDYPQFESWAAAKYDRPGGPFAPHTGDQYMYSQIADVSYKRLTRTITVPAGGGEMSFWTSYNTEQNWDYMFVEARTAGQDDWTTLADLNGHNSEDLGPSTPPGEPDAASCPAGWRELHPQLDHYQTNNGDGTCSPTGSTGAWWAQSGGSGGWQQWRVDLGAFAGRQVELSIAYASDWATQGLGVFVDDIDVSTGEGTTSFEEDDDPMDGWAVTGPPAGSGPNSNNFVRSTAAGFPEGAVIATGDTLYMGFGFEGISDAASRNVVMGRAMGYLLR